MVSGRSCSMFFLCVASIYIELGFLLELPKEKGAFVDAVYLLYSYHWY